MRKPNPETHRMRMKMLAIYSECAEKDLPLPSRVELGKLLDRTAWSVVHAHQWLLDHDYIKTSGTGSGFLVTIVSTGKMVSWKGKYVPKPKPEVTDGRRCLGPCREMFKPKFPGNFMCPRCRTRDDRLPAQFTYADPGA